MSDNIIPIVSNTPPPIDDDFGDDDFQEYGVANDRWDDHQDFGGFAEPPSIVTDTFVEEKDSLSYITCSSNSDSPKVYHSEKVVENSESSNHNADLNASEFFSAAECSMPVSDDKTQQNMCRINRSPSPCSSMDGDLNFSSNDSSKANSISISSQQAQHGMNLSPVNSFQDVTTQDSYFNVELTSNKAIDNGFDKESSKSDSFNENNLSGSETPPAVISSNQEYNPNTFDANRKFGSDNNKPEEFLQTTYLNDNANDASLSSNEFQISDDFAKCNDHFTSFPEQNTQPLDVSGKKNSVDQGVVGDNLNSNKHEIGGFADFVAFDESPLPDTTVPNNDSSNSPISESQHSTENFASFHQSKVDQTNNFAQFEVDQDIDKPTTPNENFGNFATFDSTPTENTSDFTNFDAAADDFDDFATFGDNPNDSQPGGDDDFGDFDFSSAPTSSQAPLNQSYVVSNDISKIPSWFPFSSVRETYDENITQIHQHIEQDLLRLFESLQEDASLKKKTATRPSELWDYLEDVDNAEALKFKWNSSTNHQCLLRALGIDTQNVLFSGERAPYYIPTYYAAGLGLLQPSADSIQQNGSLAPPFTNQSASPVDTTVWKSGTADSSGRSIGEGSSPVPLGNLMDANSINLDALEKRSTKRTPSSHKEQDKLDPELLELAMAVTPDSSSKKPDPLSKILATLKVTGRRNSDEEEETLSEEANEVVQKLPDLSYMRSRVLMFPVSQSAAN